LSVMMRIATPRLSASTISSVMRSSVIVNTQMSAVFLDLRRRLPMALRRRFSLREPSE
jgi:hypothetical protein